MMVQLLGSWLRTLRKSATLSTYRRGCTLLSGLSSCASEVTPDGRRGAEDSMCSSYKAQMYLSGGIMQGMPNA